MMRKICDKLYPKLNFVIYWSRLLKCFALRIAQPISLACILWRVVSTPEQVLKW